MKADAKSADIDQSHVASTYCTWRFLLGTAILIFCSLGHIALMPFLDLTMMGCNAAFAIVTAMFMSIKCLGEKFVWKNDIIALICISAGCAVIVMNIDTDQKQYTGEEALEHLLAGRAFCYYGFTFSFVGITMWVTSCFLRAIRRFELDVESRDA